MHFVPKWKVGNSPVQEAKITEIVFIWVRKAIENMSAEYPGLQEILKLSLSGSIAEGCRLKTKRGAIETDSDRVRFLLYFRCTIRYFREYQNWMSMK